MKPDRTVARRLGIVPVLLGLLVLPATVAGRAAEPQMADTARQLMERLGKAHVQSVAVVDFVDLRGQPTELGRLLAEELSSGLINAGSKIEVVDRLRLAKILQEQKLSVSGLVDPSTVREIGRISGVEALVTGRLIPQGDTVRINLLVVRTRNAQILASQIASIPRTPTITALERRALTAPCPPGEGGEEIDLSGPVIQRTEIHDLLFSLHGCTRAGDAVRCAVGVRNPAGQDDQNLYLSGKSRAVFGEGTAVTASRVSVGGQWATGTLSQAGSPLLPGVTASIGVVFEGVPEQIDSLRLLELNFHGYLVQFQDVPLDR